MSPEMPNIPSQPTFSRPPSKKFLVMGLGALLVVALLVVGIFVVKGHKTQQPGPKAAAPKTLQTSFGAVAFRYADSPVYDACSLLTLDTVKEQVKDYKTILSHLGVDQVESSPLTIQHAYVDRDIAAVLGKDGQARATGHISGPEAYGSLFDSNCVYGQGSEVGQRLEFARVYVTQKPTPLSADFLAYLASIADRKQTIKGVDIYAVIPNAPDTFFSVIMVKADKGLAVILRTASKELAVAGADEIGKKLESAPTGPLRVAYPAPYAQLVNACSLLSVADFQRFTGKPAGALAQETLYLNDLNALTLAEQLRPLVSAVRQCQRLEVDRSTTDNIAQTNLTVRQFRNESSAKKYVNDLKSDDVDEFTILPAKTKLADEAYIKSADKPIPGSPKYIFEMRLGATIITLDVEGDSLNTDATPEAFETRLLPAAMLVLQNYQKQSK